MNEYDVAVVGGGAAGLSAALVLARARRAVVVIDAGEPRNAPAAHMQGFLSRDGMPPAELLAAGRDEVAGYGGHLVARHRHRRHGPATDGGFELSLADGQVAVRPPGPGHHRPPRRAPRPPGSPRALGPRPAALPLLPRLRGPRPAPRRARWHPGRRPARAPGPAVVRRRRVLHPHRHAHRRRARTARGPGHRHRRRPGRPPGRRGRPAARCRARGRPRRPPRRGLRPPALRPRTATCSPGSAARRTRTAGSWPTPPGARRCRACGSPATP